MSESLDFRKFREELLRPGVCQGNYYLSKEADIILSEPRKDGSCLTDYLNDNRKVREGFLELNEKCETVDVGFGENYWPEKTDEGIVFPIGLQAGLSDLAKMNGAGERIQINDNTVHGLLVGRTGSGKTAFLKSLLFGLLDTYAPWELNLYLIDMKQELTLFAKNGCEAPHIRAVASTGEVNYIVSMLQAIERIMMARQRLLAALGCAKLEEFRKKEFGEEKKQYVLPRLLIVIDEFQQLFKFGTPREVNEIQRLIQAFAKLGRASGVHLLLCSQDMNDTGVSKLMDNFVLRMAKACDRELMTELFKSAAGDKNPEDAYGELNKSEVRVSYRTADRGNVLCKFTVPYQDLDKEDSEKSDENDYPFGHLRFLKDKAKRCNYNSVTACYSEFDQHTLEHYREGLKATLDARKKRFEAFDGRLLDSLILGDTNLYSPECSLVSVDIEAQSNRNIAVIAADGSKLAELISAFAWSMEYSARPEPPRVDYYSFDPFIEKSLPEKWVQTLQEKDCLKHDNDLKLLALELFIRDKATEFRHQSSESFEKEKQKIIKGIDRFCDENDLPDGATANVLGYLAQGNGKENDTEDDLLDYLWKMLQNGGELPYHVVMLGNVNRSSLAKTTSGDRWRQELQEKLLHEATSLNMLFIYFMTKMALDSTVRSAFDLFIIDGNRESDYETCGMENPNRSLEAIAVSCHQASADRSLDFKKYRMHIRRSQNTDRDWMSRFYSDPDKTQRLEYPLQN